MRGTKSCMLFTVITQFCKRGSRLRETQEGHAKQYANTFEYTDCKTSVAMAAAPAPRLCPVRTAR